nr:MAG TPA: hypothetical protein [Caudoviricetes sp.]
MQGRHLSSHATASVIFSCSLSNSISFFVLQRLQKVFWY